MVPQVRLGDASDAALALEWPGVPTLIGGLEAPVVAFGVIDRGEHDSRQHAGGKAISSLRLLAALWELPYEIPVSRTSVPDAVWSRLRQAPPWTVRLDAECAERRVRVAARISGVVAEAAAWQAAASALGAFATLSPRVASLHPTSPLSDHILAEALMWEIGLLRSGETPQMLLEPGKPVTEHGPYQWWLAERLYAGWLVRPTVIASPKPPPAA